MILTNLFPFLKLRNRCLKSLINYAECLTIQSNSPNCLGVPVNRLARINCRPLSPHLLSLENTNFHYKMPWTAISSISMRLTGVFLYVGLVALSTFYLSTENQTSLDLLKSSKYLNFIIKAVVIQMLVYHLVAGVSCIEFRNIYNIIKIEYK